MPIRNDKQRVVKMTDETFIDEVMKLNDRERVTFLVSKMNNLNRRLMELESYIEDNG